MALDLREELDIRPESGIDVQPELDLRQESEFSYPPVVERVLSGLRPLFKPAQVVRESLGQKVSGDIKFVQDLLGTTALGQFANITADPFTRMMATQAPETIGRTVGTAASLPVDPTTYAFGGITAIPNVALRAGLGTGIGAISAAAQTPTPDPVMTTIGAVLGGIGGAYIPKPQVPSMKPSQLMGSGLEKVQTQLVDQFAPIAHFTETIKEATGKTIIIDKNPYVAARLYAGLPGRINARVRELGTAIQSARGQERELSLSLAARRSLERSARGFENPTEVRIGGKVESIANPANVLDQLEQTLGPQRFKQISQASDQFSAYFNTKLLPDLLDSGVIGKKQYAAILEKNPQYAPFDVLHYLDESADRIATPGKTFNVSSQDVIKSIKGTKAIIDDPLEAGMRRLYRSTALAERNRVAQKIVNLRGLGERAKEFIIPLKSSENPPVGFDDFSVMFDGKSKRYAIPTPLADSLKGLNAETVDMITRFASVLNKAFRAGATTFSSGFALTNPIRDFQLAKLVSKQMGINFNVRIWAKGLFEAIRRGDLYNQFEESLGSFGGFYSRLKTPGIPLRALRRATQGKAIAAVKTIINPIEWIHTVGETLELAPRLGIFGQAQKQGMFPAEAAFSSRNTTIDFSRMGTKMRDINLWIPFINARLQGTINSLGAVRKNPLGSAYVISTMITLPQVLTYLWNTRRYPEVWDDLSQFEKDNNFLFVYGEEKDKDGNYTQIGKFPKGDVGRVFGNPVENILTFIDGKDSRTLDQLFLATASDISPLGFEREGQFSTQRLIGETLPPPIKAAGIASGMFREDPYSGFPIVPRRFQDISPNLQAKPTTSITMQRLAQINPSLSPIRLEKAVPSAFGSGGRALLDELDRFQGQPQQTATILGSVKRRFFGAFGGAEEGRDFDRLQELTAKSKDKQFLEKQEVDELITRMINKDVVAARSLLTKSQQDKDYKELVKQTIVDRAANLTTFDRFLKNSPVEARATFIWEKMRLLSTPEERLAYLNDLRKKKILTEGVILEMAVQHVKNNAP